MAPAGGWPQLYAAVANGANAVYLGLSSFSARARATNFDPDTELPHAVAYCHQHGVHVYVALNTVVFDTELSEVAHLLQACQMAQVDAVIVQDYAVARLASQVAPNLVLHASTQQSITSVDGVAFATTLSSQDTTTTTTTTPSTATTRVVLGRELSVAEIQHVIQQQQQQSQSQSQSRLPFLASPPLPPAAAEIEVFVHGALCVSYSGQCFSSEAWGGRSANRGQCAQACRLPYDLVVDGQQQRVQQQQQHSQWQNNRQENLNYVLSPQDLCGLEQVPALLQAGVACFKIEGRLKDATYVAATTRAYRHAVDQAWKEYQQQAQSQQQHQLQPPQRTVFPNHKLLPASSDETVTRLELVQLFSRGQDADHDGLTAGFLDGTHHQTVVRGRSPRHRGVHMGRLVAGTSAQHGVLVVEYDQETDDDNDNKTKKAFQLGDGLVIDRGMPELPELGGSIYGLEESVVLTRNAKDGRPRRRRVVKVQLGRAVIQQWQQQQQQHQNDQEGRDDWAPVGAHVWKTHDAAVTKKFHRLASAAAGRHDHTTKGSSADPTRSENHRNHGDAFLPATSTVRPPVSGWWVQVRVTGSVGQPLQIHLQIVGQRTGGGGGGVPLFATTTTTTTTTTPVLLESVGATDCGLELAETKGLTAAQVQKAIGTLGNTEFTLVGDDDDNNSNSNSNKKVDGLAWLEQQSLWCPVSQIKLARRRAVEELQAKLKEHQELIQNQQQQQLQRQHDVKEGEPLVESVAVNGRSMDRPQPNAKDAPRRILDDWIQKATRASSSSSDQTTTAAAATTSHFSVLCRTFAQVDAICSMLEEQAADPADDHQGMRSDGGGGNLISEIIIDFLELDGMKEAMQRIRSLRNNSHVINVSAVVASPRILKPYEGGIWKSLLALEPDALLVRSTGLLYRMQALGGPGAKVKIVVASTLDDDEKSNSQPHSNNIQDNGLDQGNAQQERWVTIPRLLGDFSLNIANALSAFELLSYNPNINNHNNSGSQTIDTSGRGGATLDRVTASYDLNGNAIARMAKLLGPWSHRLEVVVHCKMPIFHTEHCVFARFLTKGNSYLDCGHACTRHSLHLRDAMTGLDNLVLADMGCRNTVFAAQAQSGVHSMRQWEQAGVRQFRIELVDETAFDARQIVQTYVDVYKGFCKPSVAWELLQDCRDSNGRVTGVTLGSFENTKKERRAGQLT
ncbi:hypothetical protein ACA910_008135 [Epithemia clementina (nom. ined.)]